MRRGRRAWIGVLVAAALLGCGGGSTDGDGEGGADDGDPPGDPGALAADAGPDQTVFEGRPVVLVGSGEDEAGGALTFDWRQIGGESAREMTIAATAEGRSELRALTPYVTQDATLVFELVVTRDGEIATDTVQVQVTDLVSDPQLEPGFPVQTFEEPGFFQTGPQSLFVAVGNLDADRELETMITATGRGPLYAWNHDGSLVDGWPEMHGQGTGYPSIGNLQGAAELQEIAAGYGPFPATCELDRYLLGAGGELLPGWPQSACNAGTTRPPALADMDGDGIDEIFFSHEGFRTDGSRLAGWPEQLPGDPIAVGDIDGDGELEVVISSYDFYIDARNLDNTSVAGFPVDTKSPGYTVDALLLGDVNGDGRPEIIRPRKADSSIDYQAHLEVYDDRGQLLWTRRAYADFQRHASPALADLTGDGVPEIVMQTNSGVSVWRGDGEPLPGWPVAYADIGEVYSDMGSSAPAIGDVDGDQSPDVVFASQTTSSSRLYAHASDGVPLEGFPVEIEGCEARAPAIADIDLDGRNEIIVGGASSDGIGGDMDALWVYDLGGESHGRIEWGQLGGDARHRFVYPVPPP